MANKDDIDQLIRGLENVQKRAPMFMSEDQSAIVNFLSGFHAACGFLGLTLPGDKFSDRVASERGWELTSAGSWREMERKGMDHSAIAAELLTIEIEAWKRRKDQGNNPG
jgi:hypothetical protein